MSEAVLDLEGEKLKITPRSADLKNIHNTAIRDLFSPAPSVKLHGTRNVGTGIKVAAGSMPVSLAGEKEPVENPQNYYDEDILPILRETRNANAQDAGNRRRKAHPTYVQFGPSEPDLSSGIDDVSPEQATYRADDSEQPNLTRRAFVVYHTRKRMPDGEEAENDPVQPDNSGYYRK